MKSVLPVYLDDAVKADFELVSGGAHLRGTRYAALLINEVSKVKPEFALQILTMIPPKWKKRKATRPPMSLPADSPTT